MFILFEWPGGLLATAMAIFGLWLATRIPIAHVDKVTAFVGTRYLSIAFATLAFLSANALLIYHNRPFVIDEYMPYFQAQIFAQGRLWGRFPPEMIPWLVPAAYDVGFMNISHQTGKIVSYYWPGFALLLTPFMKLGVPWLLNPLLASGSLLLLAKLAKKINPEPQAAGWAILFALASPAFMVNGISYFSMNAHLFMNLLYAVLILELTPLRLIGAGMVGSIALILHNPLPHMLFAVPWIFWLVRQPHQRTRNLALLLLGYLPLIILLGFGWEWLRGEILREGIAAPSLATTGKQWLALPQTALQIAHSVFQPPSFNLLLIRLLDWLKVFAWAVPGLPILAMLGFAAAKENKPLRLWGWSALLTLAGYLFVPCSQGHGWGSRYFHSAWAALPLLSTAFLVAPNRNPWWRQMAMTTLLLSLLFGTGLRFYQTEHFIGNHRKQAPPYDPNQREICFINTEDGYYKRNFVQNDPFLANNVLFFISHGRAKDEQFVKRLFPAASLQGYYGNDSVWRLPPHSS